MPKDVVQAKLKALSYKVDVDGFYSNSTESIVLKFQQEHGIMEQGQLVNKFVYDLIILV